MIGLKFPPGLIDIGSCQHWPITTVLAWQSFTCSLSPEPNSVPQRTKLGWPQCMVSGEKLPPWLTLPHQPLFSSPVGGPVLQFRQLSLVVRQQPNLSFVGPLSLKTVHTFFPRYEVGVQAAWSLPLLLVQQSLSNSFFPLLLVKQLPKRLAKWQHPQFDWWFSGDLPALASEKPKPPHHWHDIKECFSLRTLCFPKVTRLSPPSLLSILVRWREGLWLD